MTEGPATGRAPGVEASGARQEAPSEDAGSRSLPIAAERLRVPTPAAVGSTVPRVPAIDSETSATLRVPSVGAAGDSAGSWPRTDGWDLDDDGDAAGAGPGSGSVPSVPKPAAASVPSIPKPGSIPSVPKPAVGAKPGASKDVGTAATLPKLGTAKELGTVPPTAKAGPAKEVGSVPSVPKLGSVPKVGPLPKPGARPAPASRRAAAEDADARPLFGSALAADGSLLTGSAPGSAPSEASGEPALDVLASFDVPPIDAAAIDASAPPSSASPLDALPSFDAGPSELGAPQDGFPSMDSSALLGAALEPSVPYDPGPRLPLPGMLRDGAALAAADFRGPARTPRSQPAAAMPPPRGVVPPKPRDEEEPPRLRPGDTQSFVAQVTEELMEDFDRQRAEKAAAAALAAEAPAELEPVAARPVAAVGTPSAAPVSMPSLFPVEPAPAYTREAESKRRGMILGVGAIGLAAAIGLFVWLSGDDEKPTQTAAVTTPAPRADEPKTPGADAEEKGDSPALPAPTKAEEAPPVEPEPAADDEAVAAEPAAAEAGAEPAEPAAAEAEAGADGAAEAEPVDDGASQGGSSSRKSSGKSSRSGSKSGSGSSDAAKADPAPTPKTDDAPSAAKLLKQARSAYNAGKGSTAYSLASKSNRMEPSGEAAEVMALAACQMGSADKAKAALRTVPLFSRGSVRSTCKTKHNVKLGL